MALYKYFSQDGPALPRKITCESSALTQKDLEKTNTKVKRSIEREAAKPQKASPRGKYNDYTPQERAWIGKYAAENGPTKAAKHFSQVLNRKVPETTARRLKAEYLQRATELPRTCSDGAVPVVLSLSTKQQGRPLLLGSELDGAVQDYIKSMRMVGGVVNTAIVMAAAEGIISS